jgi:hypothetical protein
MFTSVHLEIVLILMQYRCTGCTKRNIARKSFWTHPMELLGDVVYVEPRFGPFRTSVSVG